MHRIAARNEHGATDQLRRLFKQHGYEVKNNGIFPGCLMLPMPIMVLLQHPEERVSFWEIYDPLRSFITGLKFLDQKGKALSERVKVIKNEPSPSDVHLVLEEGPDARTYIQKVDGVYLHMMIQSATIGGVLDCVVPSMFQEFIAKAAGCKVGSFWWSIMCQWLPEKDLCSLLSKDIPDPYSSEEIDCVLPMISINLNRWRRELSTLLTEGGEEKSFVDPFFTSVAVPIIKANILLQQNELDEAHAIVGGCQSKDWKRACQNYIKTRKSQHEQK